MTTTVETPTPIANGTWKNWLIGVLTTLLVASILFIVGIVHANSKEIAENKYTIGQVQRDLSNFSDLLKEVRSDVKDIKKEVTP